MSLVSLRGEREIVLDTETTGLDPSKGHCVVEIGCVELMDAVETGRTYHAYINPMRDMPAAAFAVHGLSQEFLSQFSPFSDIAEEFLEFISDAPLVIHNAAFDMRFLSAELKRHGHEDIKNPVIDTLKLAKEKYPGAPASLDMLCRRFKIDTTKREKHGALLDAQLLSAVYLELLGGAQPKLSLNVSVKEAVHAKEKKTLSARRFLLTEEEMSLHSKTLLKISSNPWNGNG